MVNFNPIRVVVFDLNRAIHKENITLGTVLGIQGDFLTRERRYNGSSQWYIWSVTAIILECNMEKDENFKTKSKDYAKVLARLHLSDEGVCDHLKIQQLKNNDESSEMTELYR